MPKATDRDLFFGTDADRVLEAARAAAPHHRPLLRTADDGRRLSAAMLPFFRVRPPRGFGVLTTTGAKSGLARPKCVRVALDGGRAYLVALRPPAFALANPRGAAAWVWNIRTTSGVTLRVRGGTRRGTARELTDPAELRHAHSLLCDTVNLFDFGECLLHLRGVPTPAKVRELHDYWFATGIPVAIDLAE